MKIVLIVGASGVGKDTLLQGVKNKIEANFAQRYITRAADTNEANFHLDHEALETLDRNDYFISTWEAHGNKYAIAKNQIKNGLNIISVSRSAIKDFEREFDDVTTIEISLPRDMLYERLKARGRENEEQIQKRLNRSYESIEAMNLIHFINDKPIEKSTEEFVKILSEC